MKKNVFFLMLIGMISIMTVVKAQVIDATIENGISNIGYHNENNFRNFSLDVCPIRMNDGSNFFGLYGENNEVFSKNETEGWVSRFSSFHGGLSFNTKFGADEDDANWYLKARIGVGQSITRTDVASVSYKDKQKDFNLQLGLNLGVCDPESYWFSRHMLSIDFRQPFSKSKEIYFGEKMVEIGDSMTWNNQLIRTTFTETIGNFNLSSDDDWVFNVDLMLGFGLEHKGVGSADKIFNYYSVGAGFSIFKLPYFNQNIIEIIPEMQFASEPRFFLKFKVNLVPIIFRFWDKETFEIKVIKRES